MRSLPRRQERTCSELRAFSASAASCLVAPTRKGRNAASSSSTAPGSLLSAHFLAVGLAGMLVLVGDRSGVGEDGSRSTSSIEESVSKETLMRMTSWNGGRPTWPSSSALDGSGADADDLAGGCARGGPPTSRRVPAGVGQGVFWSRGHVAWLVLHPRIYRYVTCLLFRLICCHNFDYQHN